jgi:hypothetical protein
VSTLDTTDVAGDPTGASGGDLAGGAGADTATGRADAYLATVRRHLDAHAGLAGDERDDLLDELATHVHEVAAGDDRPLDEVLGTPQAFADELLASAGLEPGGRRGRLAGVAGLTRVAGIADVADRGAATARRMWARLEPVGHHSWVRAAVGFLPELRPAWWVARGYLIVYGLGFVVSDDNDIRVMFPYPALLDSRVLGFVAGFAAAVASVRLARRAPASRWRWVVNALAIGAAVLVLSRANDIRYPDQYVDTAYAPPAWQLSHPDGLPITNIYAYDAAGELIDQVLLYDQDGRPIEVGDAVDPATGQPFERDVALDRDGFPVVNAYPVAQFTWVWEDTGVGVRRPVPRPIVVPPALSSATDGPGPAAGAEDTDDPGGAVDPGGASGASGADGSGGAEDDTGTAPPAAPGS